VARAGSHLDTDLADQSSDDFVIDGPAQVGPRSNETRLAIMVAARASFIERGISATRLAAVARAAYVAPSTVSLHFGNKEGLFAACVDQEVEELITGARRVLVDHPYPGLSGDLLRMLAETVETKPLLSAILLRSPGRWGSRFYDSPIVRNDYHLFVDELRRAQQAGLVRDDLDAEFFGPAVAQMSISALWSLMVQHGEQTSATEDVFTVMVAALFYPLNKALELLEVCEPWREAHRYLPLKYEESPLVRLSESLRSERA